jgi:hypothetical protein
LLNPLPCPAHYVCDLIIGEASTDQSCGKSTPQWEDVNLKV